MFLKMNGNIYKKMCTNVELIIYLCNMNETVFIYSLKDPITYQIKYIGKTIDINRRYKEHIQTHRNRKSKKNSWVISLIKNGLEPIMEILEECNLDNWEERETFWISYYKDLGFNLKNIQHGGGRTEYVFTETARQNMSDAQKLRWTRNMRNKKGNYVLSKEERNKRSKNAKENPNIMNNLKKGSQSCKVEVLQLSKDKKFIKKWESLSDASRALNINIGNISKCLKGKTQSCGGFIWEYKNQTLATLLAHSVKPEATSPLGKG